MDFESLQCAGRPAGLLLFAIMTRAGNAAVMSLILPGVGQIYNGDFLRGIFWLIITPGFWIGTGGFLGWICHVIAAYSRANSKEGT